MKINIYLIFIIIFINYLKSFGHVLIKEKQNLIFSTPKYSFVNVDILSPKNKNNFIKNKKHVIIKRKEGLVHVEEDNNTSRLI
jgi:hypothetical protein